MPGMKRKIGLSPTGFRRGWDMPHLVGIRRRAGRACGECEEMWNVRACMLRSSQSSGTIIELTNHRSTFFGSGREVRNGNGLGVHSMETPE